MCRYIGRLGIRNWPKIGTLHQVLPKLRTSGTPDVHCQVFHHQERQQPNPQDWSQPDLSPTFLLAMPSCEPVIAREGVASPFPTIHSENAYEEVQHLVGKRLEEANVVI